MNRLPQFIITILLLLQNAQSIAHCQEFDRKQKEKLWRNKEELEALGLTRFFWEGSAFLYLRNGSGFGGTAFKVGHNFYIIEKRFTGVLRFTWAKTGLTNYGGIFNPLHLGIGPIITLGKKSNLEATINGGIVCATDDAIYPQLDFFPQSYLDLKFNLRKTSFSLSYCPWKIKDSEILFDTPQRFYLLAIGRRF